MCAALVGGCRWLRFRGLEMASSFEMSTSGRTRGGGTEAAGFTTPSRAPASPIYNFITSPLAHAPTPDRNALYELSIHDLTYKVRLHFLYTNLLREGRKEGRQAGKKEGQQQSGINSRSSMKLFFWSYMDGNLCRL